MTDNARIDEGKAKRQFKLWFFRDLTDEQRVKMLRLMMPDIPARELETHVAQGAGLDFCLDALARRSIQDQPEAVAWMGYWPGAGSINSETKTTHSKNAAERWAMDGAEVTPLAAIASAPPPIAGAGWKVVPVEPTLDQRKAGYSAATAARYQAPEGKTEYDRVPREVYYAMIAAAPASPVPDNTDARAQVKALEWRSEQPYLVARPFPGVHYAAEPWKDGATLTGNWFGRKEFDTLAEAKAAAQADYASRILAAILPGTDASGGIMTRPIPLRTVAILIAAYIAVITLFWNADTIRDWFWRVVG